ncbi:MAG: hypothetical protein Q4A41_02455 [Bacillota bacterium]|nr:hypothetical protein [Bacillota bacterium]
MRDWKLRWIVAVVLLFLVASLCVYNTTATQDEAAELTKARVVESQDAFREALKTDGLIYAKGTVEGMIDMDDVSLVDGVLSDDPSKMPKDYNRVFFGEYMEIDVQLGQYKYDKEIYEKSSRFEYQFVGEKTLNLRTKTVGMFGVEFNIENAKNPLERCALLKQNVAEGMFVLNGSGQKVPSLSYPKDDGYYISGYQVRGIPTKFKGALKLRVENGTPAVEDIEVLPESDMQMLEEMAAGNFNYAEHIAAYVALWIVLVLVAWLIMKFLGK